MRVKVRLTMRGGRGRIGVGREPINSDWSADVYFDANNGLTSDVEKGQHAHF
jgi:hypothetical protein